jgi:hypothetical protein
MSTICNDNRNNNQQCDLCELARNALIDMKSDIPNSKTWISNFVNITKADEYSDKIKEKRKDKRKEKKRKDKRKEKKREKRKE